MPKPWRDAASVASASCPSPKGGVVFRAGDNRAFAIAVTAIGILALAVRLAGAFSYPLWADEVASARVLVEPTLPAALAQVARTESTPPGWYLLGWLLHRLGFPVLAVRGVSVLCGVAVVVLLMVIARRLVGSSAALLCGVLAALDWQLVYHGRELRSYALLALATVAFAAALEAAARLPTKARLAALAATVVVGSLTHYFFLFSLVTGLAWLFASVERRGARVRVCAALGIGLVPFLAWLPAFLDQYERAGFSWIGRFATLKLADFYSTVFDGAGWLYGGGQTAHLDGTTLWRLAVLVVVLAGAALLARRGAAGQLCALLAVAPVVFAGLVWLAGPPILDARNLIGVAPFALLAAATALVSLPRSLAVTAALATVAICAYLLPLRPFGPPADRIAQTLVREGWRASEPIDIVGRLDQYRLPLGWYLPGRPSLEIDRQTGAAGCATTFLIAPVTHSRSGQRTARAIRVGQNVVTRLAGLGRRCATLPANGHLLAVPAIRVLSAAGGTAARS